MPRQVVGSSCRTGSHITFLADAPPQCSPCTLSSCNRHTSLNADPRAIQRRDSRSGSSVPLAFRGRMSSTAAEDFVRRGQQTQTQTRPSRYERQSCYDVVDVMLPFPRQSVYWLPTKQAGVSTYLPSPPFPFVFLRRSALPSLPSHAQPHSQRLMC